MDEYIDYCGDCGASSLERRVEWDEEAIDWICEVCCARLDESERREAALEAASGNDPCDTCGHFFCTRHGTDGPN